MPRLDDPHEPPPLQIQNGHADFGNAEFERRARYALRHVVDYTLSLDTIHVLLRRPLSAGQTRKLRRMNTGAIRDGERSKWCWTHPHILRMHQPTPVSLACLAAATDHDYIMCAVHIALDFVMPTSAAAYDLRQFFKRHVTVPWHGLARCREIDASKHRKQSAARDHTTYFGKAWTRRNVALYVKLGPGKPPALRLEARISRAATCRRYGLDDLTALACLDLAAFAADYFPHHMRLSMLDCRRLRRRLDRETDKHWRQARWAESRMQYRDLLERIILHAAQAPQWDYWMPSSIDDLDKVPVQEMIDSLPDLVDGLVTHLPLALVCSLIS
jgi:hypothetical protein